MNASGTGSRLWLTKNREHDGSPAWSPDGRRIAFVHGNLGDSQEIYVMNADGTSEKRLTTGAGPAWQPIPQAP